LRNVETANIEDVRLSLESDDLRPVLKAENVKAVKLDNLKFTRVPDVDDPIITTHTGSMEMLNMPPAAAGVGAR
jgi:hypothetical protein